MADTLEGLLVLLAILVPGAIAQKMYRARVGRLRLAGETFEDRLVGYAIASVITFASTGLVFYAVWSLLLVTSTEGSELVTRWSLPEGSADRPDETLFWQLIGLGLVYLLVPALLGWVGAEITKAWDEYFASDHRARNQGVPAPNEYESSWDRLFRNDLRDGNLYPNGAIVRFRLKAGRTWQAGFYGERSEVRLRASGSEEVLFEASVPVDRSGVPIPVDGTYVLLPEQILIGRADVDLVLAEQMPTRDG